MKRSCLKVHTPRVASSSINDCSQLFVIAVQALNCPEAKLGLHIFEHCEANSDVQSMQGTKELTRPGGLLSTAVIYELYGSFMLSENVNGCLKGFGIFDHQL